MTGAEAAVTAAIGRGIAKAVATDAKEQASVNKALLDAVKETPEFKQAVQRFGERVALRQGVATGLFQRFARWLPIKRDYLETRATEDLQDEFADKLGGVPDEDLRPPKRSIAGPAFEGLGHVIDEPELRELYLELLARAVDAKYADMAHPSFVEVVRQLSGEEAVLLRRYLLNMSSAANVGIVALQSVVSSGRKMERLYSHLLDLRDEAGQPIRNDSVPTYVDNWIRLGLVEVHYDGRLSEPGSYDWVQERSETADARVAVANRKAPVPPDGQDPEAYILDVVEGYMTSTSFGRSFALAVGLFGRLER